MPFRPSAARVLHRREHQKDHGEGHPLLLPDQSDQLLILRRACRPIVTLPFLDLFRQLSERGVHPARQPPTLLSTVTAVHPGDVFD